MPSRGARRPAPFRITAPPRLVLAARSNLARNSLGLLQESLYEAVMWHPADLLALGEQQSASGAGRDPDVGVARLPRAVDLAAHHRYLHRGQVHGLDRLLDLLRQLQDVELGAPARRARHEIEAVLAETQRLKDLLSHPNLFGGVGGK